MADENALIKLMREKLRDPEVLAKMREAFEIGEARGLISHEEAASYLTHIEQLEREIAGDDTGSGSN